MIDIKNVLIIKFKTYIITKINKNQFLNLNFYKNKMFITHTYRLNHKLLNIKLKL